MDLRAHCRLMARHHGWAFERLYAGVDLVSDADYRAGAGLFFGSIHATLNHLLLADRVWHGRLTGAPFAFASLRDTVEDDRSRLREQLCARDRTWTGYLDSIDDATLAGLAHYRKGDGAQAALPCASILLHVFQHGAHHRGQVSAVLTRLGLPAPEMDLPYLLFTLDPTELSA